MKTATPMQKDMNRGRWIGLVITLFLILTGNVLSARCYSYVNFEKLATSASPGTSHKQNRTAGQLLESSEYSAEFFLIEYASVLKNDLWMNYGLQNIKSNEVL